VVSLANQEVVKGMMASRTACRGVPIVMRRFSAIDVDTKKDANQKSFSQLAHKLCSDSLSINTQTYMLFL